MSRPRELAPMADYATSCKYDEIETIGRGRFGVVKKVERRMDQKVRHGSLA